MPIRHPLDCAVSNMKTGLSNMFVGTTNDSPIQDVVRAIIDEFHWFATCKQQFDDRFFCFFENDMSREMLINLATFLKLEPTEQWLSNAQEVMQSSSHYDHDAELVDFYRETVKDRLNDFPDFSAGLLRLVEAG